MATAAAEDKAILHTVLEYESKLVPVYLTTTQLIIDHSGKPRSHDESLDARPSSDPTNVMIELREIIVVRPEQRHPVKEKKFRFKPQHKPALLQEDKSGGTNTFSVFVIKRISKHRWRHKSLLFTCRDYGTCQIWVDKIQELLKSPECNRPKRLVVFVNPFGGKKKAPKIFNDKVRPLFELAGIYSEVILTKRQFHARDIIYEYDLDTVDGLVCVGGDGTFAELLNGLLDRTNAEAGISQTFRHKPISPSLRIGIIPAGSTDAIVYSLVGINDPITSALQIILGDSIGMDVTALYKKEQFLKYTVTMSGYGYYGDLLQDSERLRWMGPKRYTWSGFKTFLANKAYEGEVSFLLASEEESHPRDQSICYAGCEKCENASLYNEQGLVSRETQPVEFDLGATGDVTPSTGKRASFMMKDGWHHVKGKFCAINLVTITCRCDLSPIGMSPSSHLGDGCMDLILIQNCTRLQYLRHLTRIPHNKSDQFDFDFIQVYRVKEFSFQPMIEPEDGDEGEGEERQGCGRRRSGHMRMTSSSSSNSVWNCDGEVHDHPSLYIQVHCQLIKLFGRGVEKSEKEMTLQCPPCCSAYDSDK